MSRVGASRAEPPLPIERLGSLVLRSLAEPVSVRDPGIRALVRRMFATMYSAAGQGLAAPQVGRRVRVAVVDVAGTRCSLIDHLDGVLYIDRLSALDRAVVVARYRRKRGNDRIRTGSIPSTGT